MGSKTEAANIAQANRPVMTKNSAAATAKPPTTKNKTFFNVLTLAVAYQRTPNRNAASSATPRIKYDTA